MTHLNAKLVVLGSQYVGKTSVVLRHAKGTFKEEYKASIGASFFKTEPVAVGQYRVTLNIWDTCGQERFRAMTPFYYKKANAAILMYDITSLDSFYDVMYWVKELRDNVDNAVGLCLIGNKTDMGEMREVGSEHAAKYASSIDALFFETSALSNAGIKEAFTEIFRQIVNLHESNNNNGVRYSSGTPVTLGSNQNTGFFSFCCGR